MSWMTFILNSDDALDMMVLDLKRDSLWRVLE